MRRYRINRVRKGVPLCGDITGTPWADADVARIDRYPWYKRGKKQSTIVRALYDSEAIYLQYRCRDRHIFTKATELNGRVWLDSCVEFFAAPWPQQDMAYFNLEMNCCGVMLMHFGSTANQGVRRRISTSLAARIEIVTSVPGSGKDESPDDRSWWLAARLPYEVVSSLARRPVKVAKGSVWRGNFFRCGGKTDPQYASWGHIRRPKPDFHLPEFFGELHFR